MTFSRSQNCMENPLTHPFTDLSVIIAHFRQATPRKVTAQTESPSSRSLELSSEGGQFKHTITIVCDKSLLLNAENGVFSAFLLDRHAPALPLEQT